MVDKTITIKGATDKELDDMIIRLRKENELQSLIQDMMRKSSSGYVPYDYQMGVSTEKPIESLYHYGVLGMKWGHKKGQLPTTVIRTRNSEDHDKKILLKGRKLHELSNEELQSLSKRFQLEKQYKEIKKSERSLGKKIVDDIIGSIAKGAKDSALNFISKESGKLIEEMLQKTRAAMK